MMTDSKGLFSHLKQLYSPDTYKIVGEWQKLVNLEARLSCHLTFSHRCLAHQLIPKGLVVRCPLQGPRASHLTLQHELRLLRLWISQCHARNRRTRECLARVSQRIGSLLTSADFAKLQKVLDDRRLRIIAVMSLKQKNKFHRLTLTSKQNEQNVSKHQTGDFVTNLSSYTPSAVELEVLDKGQKFAINNGLDVTNTFTSIEYVLKKEVRDRTLAESIRQEVVSAVKHRLRNFHHVCNLSRSELIATRDLSQRRDIVILPADKGRSTVIMDSGDYHQKVLQHLGDIRTYGVLKKNPLLSMEQKVNDILKCWFEADFISLPVLQKLRASGSTVPKFYGLPKVHKVNVPIRPIVSFIGSPSFQLSKFLARILSPLAGTTDLTVKNAGDLATFLQSYVVPQDHVFVSFDATALFTSVPIDKAYTVVKECLKSDKYLGKRTKLTIDEIMKGLSHCLSNTFFQFDETFYEQKRGVAMGSSVSTIVANLVMEDIEHEALSAPPTGVHLWRRYVDDVLAVVHRDCVDLLLVHLNTFCSDIQFTVEKESENSIPFLDIKIYRHEDGHVSTSVYRKPSCKGQYTHFSSAHSYQQKISVIRTLTRRAFTHCSDLQDRKSELDRVTEDLMKCGYPNHLIRRFHKPLTRVLAPAAVPSPRPARVYLNYTPIASDVISRILRKFNIQCIFKPKNTMRNQLFHVKSIEPILSVAGCVYQINCAECYSSYIGQTGRRLYDRRQDHVNAVERGDCKSSAVADHAWEANHLTDFNRIRILCKERFKDQREWMEALFISLSKPSLNRDEGSRMSWSFHNACLSLDRRFRK